MNDNRNNNGNALTALMGLVGSIISFIAIFFLVIWAFVTAQKIADHFVKRFPILEYFSPIKFAFLGFLPLLCIGMIWADPAHWVALTVIALLVIAIEVAVVAGAIKLHKKHVAKKSA